MAKPIECSRAACLLAQVGCGSVNLFHFNCLSWWDFLHCFFLRRRYCLDVTRTRVYHTPLED